MPTLYWVIAAYLASGAAVIGMVFAAAIFALVFHFGTWLFLMFVAVVPAGVFGVVYRKGMARGASPFRALRIGLAGSWLFLGVVPSYLGYATTSWVLYRGQPGAHVPELWRYLWDPDLVVPLARHRNLNDDGVNRDREDMGAFCVVGAMLSLAGAAGGLSSLAISNGRGLVFPDESAAEPVVDSKWGQRGAGMLLTLLAGGGTVLLWKAPRPLGTAMAVPAIIVPVFLVFGLGLMLFPLDPASLQQKHGVHHARSLSHLPKIWVGLPFVGLVAGLLNWWLLWIP